MLVDDVKPGDHVFIPGVLLGGNYLVIAVGPAEGYASQPGRRFLMLRYGGGLVERILHEGTAGMSWEHHRV